MKGFLRIGAALSFLMCLMPAGALALCVASASLPNRVIVLFDGRNEPDPGAGRIAVHLLGSLHTYGLFPVYVDVARQLPADIVTSDIAGVLSWFSGPVPNANRLGAWLDAHERACGKTLPRVAIGDPGGAGIWVQFGVDAAQVAVLHDGRLTGLETALGWFGTQAALVAPPGVLIAPVLPAGAKPIATFSAPDGTRRALGYHKDADTWLSEHSVLAPDGRGAPLLLMDPERIVAAIFGTATGTGLRPVPDTAMIQGRRISLLVLLADGWNARAPALEQAASGIAAHEFAATVFGPAGAALTFVWPDAQSAGDSGAVAAGRSLANMPHVSALTVTDALYSVPRGASELPSASEHLLDPAAHLARYGLAPLRGEPGFADPLGFHARPATVARSGAPWPIRPDIFVIKARDLLEHSARSVAIEARLRADAQDRAAMDLAHYGDWLRGAVSARLAPEGVEAWHVTERGALDTLRVDGAGERSVDLDRSRGVLGAARLQSALYVWLDPASQSPFISLTHQSDTAMRLPRQGVGLVSAGPRLSDMARAGCKTTFSALGSGQITVSAAQKPDVSTAIGALAVLFFEPDRWTVDLPASDTTVDLTFAVACD